MKLFAFAAISTLLVVATTAADSTSTESQQQSDVRRIKNGILKQ